MSSVVHKLMGFTPRPRSKPSKENAAEVLMQAQIVVLRALQAYQRFLDVSHHIVDEETTETLKRATISGLRRYVLTLRASQELIGEPSVRVDRDVAGLSECAWILSHDNLKDVAVCWNEHASWAQCNLLPLLRARELRRRT